MQRERNTEKVRQRGGIKNGNEQELNTDENRHYEEEG